MAVDRDICPRHHGVTQHGGGRIIGVALKGGRKLHYLLLGQGASRQRIAGGHARHCGGGGRAQATRLRDIVMRDHPQAGHGGVGRRECGANRLDHQVGAIARQVFCALAKDFHRKTRGGDLYLDGVIQAQRHAQGVISWAQVRRGGRDGHDCLSADFNFDTHSYPVYGAGASCRGGLRNERP